MLHKINEILVNKNLLTKEQVALIGVSGGVDSMVLADVLIRLGYKIAIGHVNHKMRGEESDLDESLVIDFAREHQIVCHTTILPERLRKTKNFQQQARNFRYQWFTELCDKNHYHKVATAHQLNDEIETFFINLFRAAGLTGLSGMDDNLNGKIIRPLLSITKGEIYDYAATHHIPFREDQSNEDPKYLRNKLRKQFIPALRDIGVNTEMNISKSIQYLKETEALLQTFIHENNIVKVTDSTTIVNLQALSKHTNATSILYYIAKPYGFNRIQTDSVWASVEIGAKSVTANYALTKDRSSITIKPLSESTSFEIPIACAGTYIINDREISISVIETKDIVFQKGTEYLGFDQNPFPLKARSRKSGDTFKPLGMTGLSKSLKKFITDEKMDSTQKDNLILFEHNTKICYVAPFRISELYKIKPNNNFIVMVEIKN